VLVMVVVIAILVVMMVIVAMAIIVTVVMISQFSKRTTISSPKMVSGSLFQKFQLVS
jgi:hypothetical protein